MHILYNHRQIHTVWLSFIPEAEEKKKKNWRLIRNETQRTVNPSLQSIWWETTTNNTRGNQTQVTSNSPLEVLLWRRKWNQWNQHHHLCSQRSQHKSIMFTGLISVAWWCLITSNTVLGWQYEHHNKVYNHQRTNSLYRLEVHGISQIPSIQCPIEGLLQQISWHSLEVD